MPNKAKFGRLSKYIGIRTYRALRRQWHFDNAPYHKSASTLAYLEKKNVCLLSDWPPQSPDLNKIEKKKVTERCPRNAGELCAFAKKEWDAILNTSILNLYASIPKRLKAIIKSNSRNCKY